MIDKYGTIIECSKCGTLLTQKESIEKRKCEVCRCEEEKPEIYIHLTKLQEKYKTPMLMDEQAVFLKDVMKTIDDIIRVW